METVEICQTVIGSKLDARLSVVMKEQDAIWDRIHTSSGVINTALNDGDGELAVLANAERHLLRKMAKMIEEERVAVYREIDASYGSTAYRDIARRIDAEIIQTKGGPLATVHDVSHLT